MLWGETHDHLQAAGTPSPTSLESSVIQELLAFVQIDHSKSIREWYNHYLYVCMKAVKAREYWEQSVAM